MRNIILFILLALSAVACRDHITLGDFGTESRLLMYAFPTDTDTFDIRLSATRPLTGVMPSLNVTRVTCTTDGIADSVVHVRDTVEAGFPIAIYRAIGPHRCGTLINICADADGLPPVEASTRIPQRPTIGSISHHRILYEGTRCVQLRLMFPDLADVDYYAARVMGPDSSWLEVDAAAEPLLNNGLISDMGFEEGRDFYHRMYIFNDRTFANGCATLHLPLSRYSWDLGAYRTVLYSLSRDYYLMLKSFNDVMNNDMFEYGLSFAYTTYTNVRNGYGCVAGYACDSTRWQRHLFQVRYVARCENPDDPFEIMDVTCNGTWWGTYYTWDRTFTRYNDDDAEMEVTTRHLDSRLTLEIYYEDKLIATETGYGHVKISARLKE